MDQTKSIIALAFLVLGSIFVFSTIFALISLMNYEPDVDKSKFSNLLYIFRVPIISLVLLLFVIGVVIPWIG